VCCSELQSVAVCCSMLQCVAVCCSVLLCVAVCCSVLLCVAVCCSVLQCVAAIGGELQCDAVYCCVMHVYLNDTLPSFLSAIDCHGVCVYVYMCGHIYDEDDVY